MAEFSKTIPFGPFAPDTGTISPFTRVARDVLASDNGFNGLPALIDYIPRQTFEDGMLDSYGWTDAVYNIYPDRIDRVANAPNIDQEDRTTTVVTFDDGNQEGTGSHRRWGNYLVVACGSNYPIVYIDLNSGTDVSTTIPNRPHVAAIETFGEYLVGVDTLGSARTDREGQVVRDSQGDIVIEDRRNRMRISNFGGEDWTLSREPGFDSNDIPFSDVDIITGINKTEGALIVFSRINIHVASGTATSLTVQRLSDSVGLVGHKAHASYNNVVYFVGEAGSYLTDGTQVIEIGKNLVDNTYFLELRGRPEDIVVGVIPSLKVVYITCPGARDDKVWFYSTADKEMKWSTGTDDIVAPIQLRTRDLTYEDLSIFGSYEDLPGTWDSDIYRGGRLISGVVVRENGVLKIKSFSGAPRDGVVQTGAWKPLNESMNTLLRKVSPFISGNRFDVKVQVSSTNDSPSTIFWSQIPEAVFNKDYNFSRPKSRGRFHAIRYTLSGSWEVFGSHTVTYETAGKR